MAKTSKKPEIFDCDKCSNPFPWDDSCAEFDGNFFVLFLSCKTCRAKAALTEDIPSVEQEEKAE